MNLLFIQPVLSYRGSERVIAMLTKNLAKDQHSITVLFIRADNTANTAQMSPGVKIILPPHWLNNIMQNNILFTLLGSFLILYYLVIHARQADFLISESFPCLWPTIIIGKIYRKKVIWMIHSLEPYPWPKSNIIGKSYFWTILCVNKIFYKTIDRAITNSPKVDRIAHSLFPHLKTLILIPPVESVQYNSKNIRDQYQLNSRKILLCIGQFHPQKNQQLLIDAIKALKQQRADITGICIGDGSKEQFNYEGLTDHEIIFIPSVKYADLQSYYENADCIIQASYYPEGLGMTPFEGLNHNKIPIVVKGSGAAEVIEQNKLGIVVDNNKESLAQAINEYLLNPDKYAVTIQRGNEFIKDTMNENRYAQLFTDILIST